MQTLLPRTTQLAFAHHVVAAVEARAKRWAPAYEAFIGRVAPHTLGDVADGVARLATPRTKRPARRR